MDQHPTEPHHHSTRLEVVPAMTTAIVTKETIRRRIAIYVRISTKDKGQDTMTQLMPLREYAERRGFDIHEEYSDIGISGSKAKRPGLDKLMLDARRRKFSAVVVARFDRFARSSSHLLRALEEFNKLGLDFISLNESVDTSTPMGKMIFTVLGAVAELERSLIQERVQAGVDRARRQGKQLGRPRVIVDRERLRTLAREGHSIASIARSTGIARSTVSSIIRAGEMPVATADVTH